MVRGCPSSSNEEVRKLLYCRWTFVLSTSSRDHPAPPPLGLHSILPLSGVLSPLFVYTTRAESHAGSSADWYTAMVLGGQLAWYEVDGMKWMDGWMTGLVQAYGLTLVTVAWMLPERR